MDVKILSGSANLPIAEGIAEKIGAPLVRRALERFPDSELHIEIQESVRGQDLYNRPADLSARG
jgi:ribose-phosphate pyrophosphokinase